MAKHPRKPTTLPLGTISEGTLRPEDLIPAYLDTLDGIRLTKAERATVREIRSAFDTFPSGERWNGHGEPVIDWNDEQHEQASEFLETLTLTLENHVPDYAYFGTLEGDGACFGVWPDVDSAKEDADFLHMAGDPMPTSKLIKLVFSVNDHGNVTLYRRSGNRWIEVWSVV